MNKLYPLKFKPILKEKIWGGQKIKQVLGKKANQLSNVGESWELSGVDPEVSVALNGYLKGNTLNELIEVYMGDMVGDKVFEQFGDQFPLLIKFIDAKDDLSIQVHPADEVALERHQSFGKTEMWYVMQADEGSRLISGFKDDVTCEQYLEHLNNHTLSDILASHEVNTGDVFFIPAGRVHAIGAGILLAEIQQTSDITYRIYDFDRRDDKGNLRELHTDDALDVIDFTGVKDAKIHYQAANAIPVPLVKCDYFVTNLLDIDGPLVLDYYRLDSFVVLVCVEGSVELLSNEGDAVSLALGETVLIPAELKNITLVPNGKARLLEVYVPSDES